MICTTIRDGVECAFMKKKGCSYNSGVCREIVEKCNGCKLVVEFPSGKYCNAWPEPLKKWELGNCNMASHVGSKDSKTDRKRKLNPIKASKRGHK